MGEPSKDRKIVSLEESRRTRAREEAKRKQAQRRAGRSAWFRRIPAWALALAAVFVVGLAVFLYDLNRYTAEFGSVDAALKHMAGPRH
jgi:type VI protein secretion system component VasF